MSAQYQYPLDSLPHSFHWASRDLELLTHAPIAMISAQLLGLAAAACQRRYDVALPHGQITPCSLNLITLGESGERKSTVGKLVFKPLFEFQKCAQKIELEAVQSYESSLSAWEAERRGIIKLIEKKASKNEGSEADEDLAQRLKDHDRAKPSAPRTTRLIYDQITIPALLKGLSEHQPYASILSDEAGVFFTAPRVHDIPILNSLWNGSDISKDLASAPNIQVRDPRVSLSLQMQPDFFTTAKERYAVELRDSGFLARCLVCYPQSTQGYRRQTSSLQRTPSLDYFHERIRGLLDLGLDENWDRSTERETLAFSSDAKDELSHIAAKVETELSSGFFAAMKDFASKFVEHVCRVAALFHLVEGMPGSLIGQVQVVQASAVVWWYASEFDRVVVRSMAPTFEERDAKLLIEWFQNRVQSYGNRPYRVADICRLGPNQLRSKARVEPALELLKASGQITTWTILPTSMKGQNKIAYLLPNLQVFAPGLNLVNQNGNFAPPPVSRF